MGLEIPRDHFDEDDYLRFAERLQTSLAVLEEVLARPGFGAGPPTVGAELEMSLVDTDARPLPRNSAVLATARQRNLTFEADCFDIECNASPVPLAGRPFTALGDELRVALAIVREAAARHDGRVILTGILPTLRAADLESSALSDTPRYRALSAGLRRLRRAPFEMSIDGEESLRIACDDVTYEGATTSWQIHLKVLPADFVCVFNAAQLAVAPVLAVAGNSPTLLGRRLWDETRIALFRQAVDERVGAGPEDWRPARVSFGHGWVRQGAWEQFAESVAFHTPLIPLVDDEDPVEGARAGAPALNELRLHHGTVWRWNRAVYDPIGGGHVRVEMRALPSGPSMIDMLANAAFLLGLTLALAPEMDRMPTRITFGQARWNFYAAARRGLGSELLWPESTPPSPRPQPAALLALRLLPLAERGLRGAGVEAGEVDALLGVIRARVERGVTGARWQQRMLDALERTRPREQALSALVDRYIELSATGAPVHEWPLEP